jgi:type VII secretion protein EccB
VAGTRDLVEADSFTRRRLVTAFVSGAPAGSEVEPVRPGRTIIGGLALAVLLVAAAAVAGALSGRDDPEWRKRGLVISRERGAAYVVLEGGEHPVLRPVPNLTSARLVLGSDVEPTIIAQRTIDEQTIGADIGILGAPASLPTTARLVESGWTACSDPDHGVRARVSPDPQVHPAPGEGTVVRSAGRYYVIAQAAAEGGEVPSAHSYALPEVQGLDQVDNLLAAVGLPARAEADPVPPGWLDLFPSGAPLSRAGFRLTGAGDDAEDPDSGIVPEGVDVGDLLTTRGSEDGALLLTEDGPVPLDPFALAVYRFSPTPSGSAPREVTVDEPPALRRGRTPYAAAHWPDEVLTPLRADEECARLTTNLRDGPSVQLVKDPGDDASGAAVRPGRTDAAVDPGRGAYVVPAGWRAGARGAPVVLDAQGLRHRLVGAGTADLLGFDGYSPPVVPRAWLELFDEGVSLSHDAALCAPERKAGRTCE